MRSGTREARHPGCIKGTSSSEPAWAQHCTRCHRATIGGVIRCAGLDSFVISCAGLASGARLTRSADPRGPIVDIFEVVEDLPLPPLRTLLDASRKASTSRPGILSPPMGTPNTRRRVGRAYWLHRLRRILHGVRLPARFGAPGAGTLRARRLRPNYPTDISRTYSVRALRSARVH